MLLAHTGLVDMAAWTGNVYQGTDNACFTDALRRRRRRFGSRMHDDVGIMLGTGPMPVRLRPVRLAMRNEYKDIACTQAHGSKSPVRMSSSCVRRCRQRQHTVSDALPSTWRTHFARLGAPATAFSALGDIRGTSPATCMSAGGRFRKKCATAVILRRTQTGPRPARAAPLLPFVANRSSREKS